jgi:hypothetical protein
MKTYSSPRVCYGTAQVPSDQKEPLLNAVADFANFGFAKAGVTSSFFYRGPGQPTGYSAVLYYDGTECAQPALANVTAIPGLVSTYGSATGTMASFLRVENPADGQGPRQIMRIVPSYGTRQAIRIIHDTFAELIEEISDIPDIQARIATVLVMRSLIQQGFVSGGNPQGVDVDGAPYFCGFSDIYLYKEPTNHIFSFSTHRAPF